MKVESNSHYVRYRICRGKEYADMTHFKDVWEDGYTIDDYTISDCDIYFEPSGWHGFSPNNIEPATPVLARCFNRWVKQIEDTKSLLIGFGQSAGISSIDEFKVGDFVFCEIPPYDSDDEYDYYFLEVVDVFEDKICARMILLGKYSVAYDDEVSEKTKEEDYELYRALKNKSVFLIEREIFLRAIEIIRSLTTSIMAEIKLQIP